MGLAPGEEVVELLDLCGFVRQQRVLRVQAVRRNELERGRSWVRVPPVCKVLGIRTLQCCSFHDLICIVLIGEKMKAKHVFLTEKNDSMKSI